MMQNWKVHGCQWGLAVVLSAGWTIAPLPTAPTLSGSSAIAQIIPDGTLGNERSRVVPAQQIRGLPAVLIEGGAQRGVNLFQSFLEFNVGSGQRVYFANPTGIQNILSRVTGTNPSQILGTLGVNGTANLFLLNPRGILFGSNARLDIAGSFVASTADQLVFENGLQFSATNPQAPPLLSVSLNPGLQYGTAYRGNITNHGNLAVGAGQTLSLAGQTVTSRGGLTAPGGTVQVLGDRIFLLENARINVSAPGGGGTVLVGGDFQGKGQVPNATQTVVEPGVTISADALSSGNGGRVIVWANDATRFDGRISARGGVNTGNGGAVEVSGKQTLQFNGHVDTSALKGSVGTLLLDPLNLEINQPFTSNTAATFQADNNISFNAPVTITTAGAGVTALAGNNISVNSDISTIGGDVSLIAQRGDISVNGATIDTTSLSDRFAGSITISAGNQVVLSNSRLNAKSDNSSLDTDLATRIKISGRSVRIDQSYISTTNFGTGYAGDVAITAQDRVEVLNSFAEDQSLGIFSQGNFGRILIGQSDYFPTSPETVSIDQAQLITNNSTAEGGGKIDAGGISIRATESVSLANGTDLLSSTSRLGDAGIIIIQTPGSVSLSGDTRIATNATASAQGNAGGVGIQAGSLSMTGNSRISTSTFTQNSTATNLSGIPEAIPGSFAGAVILAVEDNITLDNSNIFNNLENGAQGEAGFILIAANSLTLLNGGQIQTLVRGKDENGPAAKATVYTQIEPRLR
ncbi:filamentous hemagglutinin N-terminal domain-containing protein [Kovacikia minuta CCNUW1]|uniref:two-partner secretion domain-containing protein n=1 Tax=Kovacikia minuta TaxID=2931930 RepID=UPI001CCEB08B|nr:filamentous hemagglutinin N-terminal domain-containing protein [Kovacikia minuta]UBF25615.1 filamentous hemagglutinin N-terminal domain-containing protein [Kovacikia minuta CCNUW1]